MVLHDFHMATRRQKDIYQLIRGGEYICHSLSTIMEANARLLSRHENFMWGLIHVRYKIHRPQYIEVTSLQPAKSHALPKRKSFFKNRKIYPQPIWLHKLYMFGAEKAISLIPTLFFLSGSNLDKCNSMRHKFVSRNLIKDKWAHMKTKRTTNYSIRPS